MSRYTNNTVQSVKQINSELEKISTAIDGVVSRTSSEANQMEVDFDLNSKRILNVADPIEQTDVVNKQYVDAVLDLIIDLGNAASVVPTEQVRQIGDGTTTRFSSPSTSLQLASSFNVYLDGVRQKPTVDYAVDISGDILFSEAPALGVYIDISFLAPTE